MGVVDSYMDIKRKHPEAKRKGCAASIGDKYGIFVVEQDILRRE